MPIESGGISGIRAEVDSMCVNTRSRNGGSGIGSRFIRINLRDGGSQNLTFAYGYTRQKQAEEFANWSF